ncbi:MAG: hypothetical protein JSS49_15180 [Planctomycetes bacterium]|nr:hypothetical protein [Planctomycetota bacterium]
MAVFRSGCAGVFLSVAVAVRAERPVAESLQVQTSASKESVPQSPGEFLQKQFIGPWGRQLQTLTTAVIFPRRPASSRSFSPLRQIVLLGGDRFTAEVIGWENESIELLLAGGQHVSVSRAAVVSISVPTGELEQLYESFEGTGMLEPSGNPLVTRSAMDDTLRDPRQSASGARSLRLGAVPVTYTLQGLEESRVQFWFRVDEVSPPAAELQVQFDFQGDADAAWSLRAAGRRAGMSIPGQVSERMPVVILKPGWHCLVAVFGNDRSFCSVDDSLVATTSRSPGKLRGLRLSAQGEAWVDDLIVSQVQEPQLPIIRPSTQDDCVAFHDGTLLFGRVKRVTAEQIVLAGQAEDRTVSWRQVDRIVTRQVDRTVSGHPSQTGLWASFEFQASVDRPRQPSDRMEATITDINRDFVKVSHPWLGEFAIGWNRIVKIEPQSFGRRLVVDGRQMHLGDAIRDDFQRPVPDGTEWIASVDTTTTSISSETQVWLILDVTEVEPASLETPPASPFLKDLRSGKLLTELTVNEHPLGSLNARLRFNAPTGHPQRLRMLVPRASWNPGPNVIKLYQIPLKESGTVFDNCEVSNLRLEFVTP